jgi:hypothetical protein
VITVGVTGALLLAEVVAGLMTRLTGQVEPGRMRGARYTLRMRLESDCVEVSLGYKKSIITLMALAIGLMALAYALVRWGHPFID